MSARKTVDTETASGTDISTPTLTPTETETETATAMMTATLAGTPTEEPPAPFESAYYTYDGDDNMVMSVINGRKPFLISFNERRGTPAAQRKGA